MKKQILILATNTSTYGDDPKETGLWLGELTHFYDILEEAGFTQDIASPKGGKVPIDPRSLQWLSTDRSIQDRREDREFMAKLENTKAIEEVDPDRYDAIYFTGGHGVMWDFIENEALQGVTGKMYESGKVVASVCHGYCALPNVVLSNGEYLVSGKILTGFSWLEEILAGVSGIIPYNIERLIKDRGAQYRKSAIPFAPYVVTDGRLVTGQNPFSAKKTAEATLKAITLANP